MRYLLFAILIFKASFLFSQDDPVLFSVAGEDVRVSEFKYIYEKNNADNADYSQESLEEYLELYKKFKLKVKRAKDLGLDTVKTLQQELAGYRKQLAKSYLKDREIADKLVNEVADRMQYDIQVSHIFVSAGEKSSTQTQIAAEDKIKNIYDKLKQNNGKGFEEMAKTLSEDKVSATRSGSLGYYTSPLPDGFYEFENAMYTTAIGDFTEPIRSKMGYHILKVTDKRAARGEMEVAHILIRKKERTPQTAQILADSVYSLLGQGRNFENMAAKFSDDTKTKSNGGYLGFFGINQYDVAFENAAFALDSDGSYTKPVESNIGFHIIKRISKRDNNDRERLVKRIQARINKNDRFEIAEKKMIEDVKQEAGFKEDILAFRRFSTALDETFYSYKWQAPEYEEDLNVFSMGGKDFSLNDFAKFAKSNIRERLKFNKSIDPKTAALELYQKYITEQVMAYEEEHLEDKYPDFKALMREYREGILLFEITKQEVWDKASQDTTGLRQYFESSDKNYMWPERVKVYKYSIESDQSGCISVYSYAQKKDHDKIVNKYKDEKGLNFSFEEMILSKDSELISGMELKPNAVTKLSMKPQPATFYAFAAIVPPSQKSLEEAKGYVIADYQDHLETAWIEKLRTMYPVKLNEKTLKAITAK